MRFSSLISAIFLCFVTESLCLAHRLNQYIKNYEIVQHQIVLHRSESSFVDEVWGYNAIKIPHVEVRFNSFKTHFHLQLTEDLDFLMLLDYSSEHSNVTTRFYEGVLKNSPGSSVIGYLYKNFFYGVIKNGSISYYLEPAKHFLHNYSEYNALIYRNNDILPLKSDKIKETYKSQTSFLKNNLNQTHNYLKQMKIFKFKKRFGISRRSSEENGIYLSKFNAQKDPTCEIEITADHTLYEYYKKNEKITKASLYLHVKHADSIFRTTDFDGDGHPDRIRVRVGKISVLKSINDPGYPMKHAKTIHEYLKLFLRKSTEHCLAFSISARPFPGKDSGLSKTNTLCAKFSRDPNDKDRSTSSNKGTLTIVNHLNQPYPLPSTLCTATHEMGHIFGSDHDPENNKICSPGGKNGLFIMTEHHKPGTLPNNLKFSPCSIKQIGGNFKRYGKKCLKPIPAACGNGIREGNEECDCGDSFTCDYVDYCCTPKFKKAHSYVELKRHQDKACHIRRTKGYECSPAENNCCTKSCKKSKDKHCTVQYRSEILCSANGLSNCVCLQDPCMICCKVNNTCVSAKSLGFPGYIEAQESTNCTTLGNTPVNETAVDNGDSVTDWRLSLFIFSFLFLILFQS